LLRDILLSLSLVNTRKITNLPLIENAVNHSKIVATEIIDDILKGAVKTDNNSTKRKHSVTDKTFVNWKEKFPWLCKVEIRGSQEPVIAHLDQSCFQ
jgi:hypothetical protein